MPKPNKPNPCGVSRIWKWNSDFLLAGMMEKFYYLKPTLVALLILIGAKMLASDVYKIPMEVSLIVIFTIFGIAFGLSAVKAKTENTSHVSLSKQDFDSKKR